MLKTNYHTHHYRCKHASGTINEYIDFAIENNFDELGISCHVPYRDRRMDWDRMDYSQLELYFKEIDEAKEKYKSIRVIKGLECEYYKDSHDYYLQLKEMTDYLILGQHYLFKKNGDILGSLSLETREDIYQYKDDIIVGIKTGIFDLVAHPDLYMSIYPKWDKDCEIIAREIIEACIEMNIPMEFNANGLRYKNRDYPNNEFWKLVSKDYREAKVFIGSDAHVPRALADDYVDKAFDIAYNLKLNLIEKLD